MTRTSTPCKWCDTPARSVASELCEMHYYRIRRHGSPHAGAQKPSRGSVRRHGYVLMSAVDHPLSDKQGLVYQHRKVLYDALGPGPQECWWCEEQIAWNIGDRRMTRGTIKKIVVDHLDGDKQNNDLSNLVPSCHWCNVYRRPWRPPAKTLRAMLQERSATAVATELGVAVGTVCGWAKKAGIKLKVGRRKKT